MDSPKRRSPGTAPHDSRAKIEKQHHHLTTIRIAVENAVAGAVVGVALAWLIVGWMDWSLAVEIRTAMVEVANHE